MNAILALLKNKNVLIWLVVIVVLVTTMSSFIAGAVKDARARDDQIQLAEVCFQECLGLQKVKSDIQEAYKTCQPFMDLEKKEPKDIKTSLLRETEQMVSASGGSITKLALEENSKEEAGALRYVADLEVELTFSELLRFLGQIKRSSLLIKLDKVNIGLKRQNADRLVVTGIISVSIPKSLKKDT